MKKSTLFFLLFCLFVANNSYADEGRFSSKFQCYAKPISVKQGSPVTYEAYTLMQTSPYIFKWVGNLNSINSSKIAVTYNNPGTYKISVEVVDVLGLKWISQCPTVSVATSTSYSSSAITTYTGSSLNLNYQKNLTVKNVGGTLKGGGVGGDGIYRPTTTDSMYSFDDQKKFLYNSKEFGVYLPKGDVNFDSAIVTFDNNTEGFKLITASGSSGNKIGSSTTSYVCLDFKSDLYQDLKSTDITELQKFLKIKNYFALEPTGYFGSRTKEAVGLFQRDNNLSQSGYVGTTTRQKIKEITCSVR